METALAAQNSAELGIGFEKHEFSLAVGEERSFTFQGFASAGYQWHVDDPNNGVVRVTTELEPLAPPDVPSTASRKTLLTLTAVAPGTETVRVTLSRQWESKTRAEHTFVITVRKD
jgi:predicted secreted protein